MFKGAKKFCYCAVTEYMTKLINDYHFIRVSHLQNFFNSFAKHLARQFLKRLEGKKNIIEPLQHLFICFDWVDYLGFVL